MPLTSLLQANYDDEALEFEELVRSRVHAVRACAWRGLRLEDWVQPFGPSGATACPPGVG